MKNIKKKLNVFIVFIIAFLHLLPIFSESKVEANNEIMLTDDDYYAIGSVMNASQDGQSKKTFYREVVDFGRDIIDTAVDNGIRLNRLVRKRGVELMLNPKNLFQVAMQVWEDFSTFHITQVKESGQTFVINLGNGGYMNNHGNDVKNYFFSDYPAYPFEIPTTGVMFEFIGSNIHVDTADTSSTSWITNTVKFKSGYSTERNRQNFGITHEAQLGHHGGVTGTYFLDKLYDGNSLIARPSSEIVGFSTDRFNFFNLDGLPLSLKKVIITKKFEAIDYAALVPYGETPPFLEIERNFTSTFKDAIKDDVIPNPDGTVKIDDLDDRAWYAFAVPEINTDLPNFTVGNDYVSNHYNTVEIHAPSSPPGFTVRPSEPENPEEEWSDEDDDDNDTNPDNGDNDNGGGSSPGDDDDENSSDILERILAAIKALPKQIKNEFLEFFPLLEGESEEGGGFWNALFEAITSLATAFGDFITSIPQMILDLLEGLLNLVESVVALFIPNSEQMEFLRTNFNNLSSDLKMKFNPITDVVSVISDLYSSPKSVFDLTMTFEGEEMPVIPPFIEGNVSFLKAIFNGAIVINTFVSIYIRFVGREEIIK